MKKTLASLPLLVAISSLCSQGSFAAKAPQSKDEIASAFGLTKPVPQFSKNCQSAYAVDNISELTEGDKWADKLEEFNYRISFQLEQCVAALNSLNKSGGSDIHIKQKAISTQATKIMSYVANVLSAFKQWAEQNDAYQSDIVIATLSHIIEPRLSTINDAKLALKASELAGYREKFAKDENVDIKKAVKLADEIAQTHLEQCTAEIAIKEPEKLLNKDEWHSKVAAISTQLNNQVDSCIKAQKDHKIANSPDQFGQISDQLKQLKQTIIELNERYAVIATNADRDLALDLVMALKKTENQITQKVNKALKVDVIEYELAPWREEAFTYQFYVGAEATSVNELFEETNARVGLQVYNRLSREIEELRAVTNAKCIAGQKCSDWSFNNLHIFGNVNIMSVGEHTFVENKLDKMAAQSANVGSDNDLAMEPDSDQASNTAEPDIEQALVGEIGLFSPWYVAIRGDITKKSYQEFMIGPIVTAGFNFTDNDQDNFNTRYYWGGRLAHNEEAYFDVLYGKSEGIPGHRVELRGQLPVGTFAGGRMFVGARANVGIDDRKDEAEDAWQIYVQWQTSFDSLWNKKDED
ncbi:hypothetical protein [Thalassotalea montiporae]